MMLNGDCTELSSNADLPWVSWSSLAETNNSARMHQEVVFARRPSVFRFVAAFDVTRAVPKSANVRPILDLQDVAQNAPIASGLAKSVPLPVSEDVFDVRDTYPLVRRVFGGTVSQTASYYGVSRKTLYKWLGSDEVPGVRDRQLIRAKALFRIAKFVENTLETPDKSLAHVVEQSAMGDLLSASDLNEEVVLSRLRDTLSSGSFDDKVGGRLSLAHRLAAAGAVLPPGKEDLDVLL